MVDTNLKYNGRNSFRIAKGDPALQSWIQDVIPNESVVVQAVVISSGIEHTGVKMGCSIFWLDADNKIIFPVQTQYFDITTIWELYWMTKQAPANAQRVFVSFFIWGDITDSAINIAEPKLGRGELPTSFTPDDYERTQYMSIGGNYLSYIKADQVQTGILISTDTLAGFDLDAPEIWMNSKDGEVKWSASPDNPLKITNGEDEFIAGLVKLLGKYGLIVSYLGTDEAGEDGVATVGVNAEGNHGIEFTWGSRKFQFMLEEPFGMYLIINGDRRMYFNTEGDGKWFRVFTHKSLASSPHLNRGLTFGPSDFALAFEDHGGTFMIQKNAIFLNVLQFGAGIQLVKNLDDTTDFTHQFVDNIPAGSLSGQLAIGIDKKGCFMSIKGMRSRIQKHFTGETTITVTNGEGSRTLALPQYMQGLSPFIVANVVTAPARHYVSVSNINNSTGQFTINLAGPDGVYTVRWMAMDNISN